MSSALAADNTLINNLPVQIKRLAGNTSYETVKEITKDGWTNSDYAVVACGDSFPDALCGTPLAKKYNAPILLTETKSLNVQAKEQLVSLKVKKVFIVGGNAVVSQAVEDEIKDLDITITRIAGIDRYETSLEVAKVLGTSGEIVVATGGNFPDALSIASIAAFKQMPILLAQKDEFTTDLQVYIATHPVTKTYVIGGSAVISDQLANKFPNPQRLSGENCYQTNVAVLNHFKDELDYSTTYLATGENFPDALAGSALASSTKSPIVLVSNHLDDAGKEFIADKYSNIQTLKILGGPAVIDDSLIDDIHSVPSQKLTYKDSLDALDYAFSGYQFEANRNSGIFQQYNYQTKATSGDNYLASSFSLMSAFLATGDAKYLNRVKETADYLNSILPMTGLIPANVCATTTDNTYLGGGGQLQALQAVAFLAREDTTYLPLMHKLTDALINYGINPENNLTWYQVNTLTGQKAYTTGSCYETQLGQNCSNVAESLIIAYETDPSQIQYRTKGLDILKAIWKCRNQSTNLIPEVWDVELNKPGSSLYPYSDFRYDDMGGAYLRALTLAYQATKDPEIYQILKAYSTSLVNAIWDKQINGGGFRYLTHLDGTSSVLTVETMYGLFIGTLLESEQVLGDPQGILYQKSKAQADNVFLSGFGLKNYMVPHQLNGLNGDYWRTNSDSQLNYAAIQFPFGMELLSQESDNPNYRLRSNRVLNALLKRSKVGDNITEPEGYVGITETQPPYGLELEYGSPSYMSQIFYLPSYILFNSIQPSPGVTIDWQNGLPLGVLGLDQNMPFFDRTLVNVDVNNKSIILSKVTGKGSIEFGDIGFGSIARVKVDGLDYDSFQDTHVTTLSGTHSYQILWN